MGGLAGLALATVAVAGSTDEGILALAFREECGRAGLGLVGFQFLPRLERRIDLCIKPAAVPVKINTDDEQNQEHRGKNPYRHRGSLRLSRCLQIIFWIVAHHFFFSAGGGAVVNGASYNGTSARRLNRNATRFFASAVGTTS